MERLLVKVSSKKNMEGEGGSKKKRYLQGAGKKSRPGTGSTVSHCLQHLRLRLHESDAPKREEK